MAVDANVLIYERIREELRGGQDADRRPSSRASRAPSSRSSTASSPRSPARCVMFWLGSGPIRGFAVTLTHRHSDVGLRRRHRHAAAGRTTGSNSEREGKSRRAYRSRRSRETDDVRACSLPISKASTSSRTTRGCPSCATRALCFGLSIVAMALSLALSSATRGLNYGVDFKGGSLIEVQSKSGPADIARAARASSTSSASAPCRSRASARPPTC